MKCMSTVGVVHAPTDMRKSSSLFAEVQDLRLLEIEVLLRVVRSPASIHFGKYCAVLYISGLRYPNKLCTNISALF